MKTKKCWAITMLIAVGLAVIGAMVLVPLSGGGTTLAQTTPYVLAHFKGYKITNPIPVLDPIVVLQDQFDLRLQKRELKIVRPGDMFFNPVKKIITSATGQQTVTPIPDERDHLERFPIRRIPGTPPETTRWNVVVYNQFDSSAAGGQQIRVGPATHILVPTEKNPVAGTSRFPDNLDHFKWYPVLQGKPVNIKVTLVDQWGEFKDVMVRNPVAFANPVRKLHLLQNADNVGNIIRVDIRHPEAHIVAYRIEKLPELSKGALIFNQFVPYKNIEVKQEEILLVPSRKGAYSPLPAPPPTNPPAD